LGANPISPADTRVRGQARSYMRGRRNEFAHAPCLELLSTLRPMPGIDGGAALQPSIGNSRGSVLMLLSRPHAVTASTNQRPSLGWGRTTSYSAQKLPSA